MCAFKFSITLLHFNVLKDIYTYIFIVYLNTDVLLKITLTWILDNIRKLVLIMCENVFWSCKRMALLLLRFNVMFWGVKSDFFKASTIGRWGIEKIKYRTT